MDSKVYIGVHLASGTQVNIAAPDKKAAHEIMQVRFAGEAVQVSSPFEASLQATFDRQIPETVAWLKAAADGVDEHPDIDVMLGCLDNAANALRFLTERVALMRKDSHE